MDRQRVLEAYVKQMIAVGPPVAIVLFGSQARGEATEDSDFDFCVIERDATMRIDPKSRRMAYWRAVRPRIVPVDLLVYAQSQFVSRYGDGWSVVRDIVGEGVWLYGSPRSAGLNGVCCG